ncbi:3-deoxy-8-phosphooctulonate synthase [Pacificimonas sp. WHA3]|uniref:2-dehydro-3-deoxyphosphooctonate aldolase n=1 Tax=Pacificimonas pallii TaxID=2827236 RepID=A0ABS6SG47_9SPHN|nr:3-deoxy-8-phosphooctulonate synthase [Pacificimonas pallii]MBV7256886.1 3-deoxy-8-phosphooctulonate synthase [Pacificimonas pallii]
MRLCGHDVGIDRPLFLIAGPCVIESEDMALRTGEALAGIARKRDVLLIYKSSFDKANRTAHDSYRGPGMAEGLRILDKVRAETGLPLLTDVHETAQVAEVADIADILQIPAFLSRQSDLIAAAVETGLPVNIKKAQFMAPADTLPMIAKARAAAATDHAPILLTERGTAFGYHNLVVDMRSLANMRETGCPVIFDATHSAQRPGGQGAKSGGDRSAVPVLARAAVAAGISGLFMETHPDPDTALSDGPNSWPLDRLDDLLARLIDLDAMVKSLPFEERQDASIRS